MIERAADRVPDTVSQQQADLRQPGASPEIGPSERRLVWLVAVGILLITTLPYLYGHAVAPQDKVFMGLMLDVPDHGQYLSWWRGFQTSFLVSNRLTPEPNAAVFFNLLWWVLAQISRWSGLGYVAVYQLLRWVGGLSFLWATYRLIAQLTSRVEQRHTAFLLVALSSGLGWVLVVLKYTLARGTLYFPLDLYIPEGNAFLCILGYPHFALAAAFIALTLEFIWRGWKSRRTRYMAIAGFIALLLGWQHAYDLLIVYGVIGAFVLTIWWRQKAFPWPLFTGGIIVFVLSCSGAVYSVLLTTFDPLWEEVLAQFVNAGVFTPSPPHLLILFGLALPLALVGVAVIVSKRAWSEENLFVIGWFVVGSLLSYVPTDFQIHMLNSWQIPVMILAAVGFHHWVAPAIGRRLPNRFGTVRWALAALVVAVIPTNVYLWTWRFVELARHDYPYYLYQDELDALEWLRDNSTPDDVVLSSITIGQYVPAISGNTAFLAHWAQTVRFYAKRDMVSDFYSVGTQDIARQEMIKAFHVDYVLHGHAERLLGEYDPATTPWLERVYAAPNANVYQVRPERLAAAR